MSSSNGSERRPCAGQAAATDSGTGSQAEPAATVARASDSRIVDGAAEPGDSVVESDADGTETVARRDDRRAGSTQRVGRFDVSSVLGSGAFGDVYLARDPQLQREVALKVPRKGTFRVGEEAERFMREARSAAGLQHPNICPVHEVFEEDDHFVIVMGYIRGRRLDQFFEPGKPLPELQAARVVARLAKALQYAHDKGIVHRDLKPANIIVDADRKEPVIMDFGLARREDSGDAALTRSGDILGSPAYMSPEQARGRVSEIGPHSDIYSLGVILYELLCGERPFGGSVAQVIGCILHVETPPPSTRHAGIDAELEAICLKAMSKEKADRYASMREFAAALSQWVKRQRGSSDDAGAVSQAGDIVESRQRAPDSHTAGSGTSGAAADAAGARHAAVDAADVSISPFETVPSADVSAITATVAREAAGEAAPTSVVSGHEASGRVGARRLTGRGGVFFGRRGRLLLIGLAGTAVLLAAIVISIQTPKGTVQFTLTDPTADITITVDGDNIDVKTLDQALHLEVGDHELKVTADGFETVTQNFTVRKGQNPALEIALLPAEMEDVPKLGGAVSATPATAPPEKSADLRKAGDLRSDNGLGLKLVWCPPGSFTMGSPEDETNRDSDEKQVLVTLTRGLWLGQTEVTQSQWQSVMGTQPWQGKSSVKEGANYPATYVSWEDAVEFCKKLTDQERRAGRLPSGEEYRLPTEAEWEYACRAGTKTAYSFGDDASRLSEHAWFRENALDIGEKYAHEVGEKRANTWNLHDMHGNVWEWCRDWYQETLPGGRDPEVTTSGSGRVDRGLSWDNTRRDSRSANRSRYSPGDRAGSLGFRVTSSPVPLPGEWSHLKPTPLTIDPATDAESEAALSALAARVGPLKGKLAADAEVATLRKELWDFRLKHFGSPLALRAAEVASELRWPTDELKREDVDPYELTVAGHGDAAKAPTGIVQILGDSRLRHSSGTQGVAFSPDGSRLASSGNDRRILIWDTATGREVARWRTPGQMEKELVFSPDGKALITAAGYGAHTSKDPAAREIHVWDPQTGQLLNTLTDHATQVRRLAICGDGQYLISKGYDAKALVWDPKTWQLVRTIDAEGFEMGASSVSNVFATGTNELNYVTLWDAASGKELRRLEGTHANLGIVFNRDGTKVASVSSTDRHVKIFRVADGELLVELKKPHGDEHPVAAVFLENPKQLVTCGYDGQINVWGATTGEKVALEQPVVSTGSYHYRAFNQLAVSRDGRFMSATRDDCSVRLFELPSFKQLHTSPDFADGFQLTAASDDGMRIATSSYDRRTAAWDIGPESARRPVYTSWIMTRGIAVSASGSTLGAVEQQGMSKYWCTQLWNWESLVRERIVKRFWADRIALSADGGLAAIAKVHSPNEIYIYSTETGQRMVTLESDPKREADLLRFAPDGRVLAVVYDGSTVVQLFECETGKHIRQMPTAHTEPIRTLDFRADGKLLATASHGKAEVKIWDWQNDLVLYDLIGPEITQNESGVASARFSPDGRRLVTSHSGGHIRIWTDFEKRECQIITGNALGDNPFDAFFTGDGRHIAAAFRAGTIAVLRLP